MTLGQKKTVVFWFLFLILLGLLLECFTFLGLSLAGRTWFSLTELRSDQRQLAGEAPLVDVELRDLTQFTQEEVLHPYIGYVFNSQTEYDDYGFENWVNPVQKRAPDKVIIGVLGGSVANHTFDVAIESLLAELRKSPLFQDKELVPIRLTGGAYKQPQQLMIVNYFMSLGAEYDILINIDGVNEVASAVFNVPKKVFIGYPQDWFLRVHALASRDLLRTIAKMTYLKERRGALARAFLHSPLRISLVGNLIWSAWDGVYSRSLWQLNEAIYTYEPEETDFVITGPRRQYETERRLYEDVTSIWKQGSLLLQRICNASGMQYYHILQPNQYLPGSKVLTDEEHGEAWIEDYPYKTGVERGYPLLIETGKELRAEGVNFYDLTQLFANKEETIYIDTCCHYNDLGYRMLAERIGQFIVEFNAQLETEK